MASKVQRMAVAIEYGMDVTPVDKGSVTLESITDTYFTDLICEGPIAGFCDQEGNLIDLNFIDETSGLSDTEIDEHNQKEQLNDPTAHAEIIAITAATNTINDWRLIDCELYVTKEPCPMCAGAIINSRIKHVIFGCYDEKEGCCGSLYQLCGDPRFNHNVLVKGGIMEEDCSNILKDFFKLRRLKK